MRFRTMMIIKAAVCLVFGVLILLAPALVYSLFGASLNEAGMFAARQYGASLIGILLLCWFARGAVESPVRRAIVLGLFVYDALGLVVALLAQFTGVFGPLGWLIVLLYLLLTLGFGYFLPPRRETA